MACIINASTTSGLVQTADLSGVLQFQQNGVALPNGGVAPAFSASNSANQTGITNATWTKVTFDTEAFDTNNNFTTSRFTPTVAGYYQVNSNIDIGSTAVTVAFTRIYKNGSNIIYGSGVNGASLSEVISSANGIVYCNGSTDYLEVFVYVSSTSNIVYSGSTFSACLVRGA
jgi:hypothetical protein